MLAAWLAFGNTLAQDNPLRTPDRPFLGTAANHIVLKGDSSSWEGYHQKLDQLVFDGTGQVNIVHIGGSHVQADMWSMELRHRMQTMVPGVRAGRGLLFPYNMAKSNNPWWYNPEYTGTWTGLRNVVRADTSTLGIAGIQVTTRDTLSTLKISFRGEAYPGYTFDRVKVLHRMDSNYAVYAWCEDSTVNITKSVNQEGRFSEFTFDRPLDTLRLRFVRTDTNQRQFTLHGIILENKDPGIFLHSCGVNGASTSNWLRCQRFSDELALLKPDLVLLSIGINDAHDPDFDAARYEANYRELIRRIRLVNPKAAILLTTNTDSYIKRRYPNLNGTVVRDVMLRLSASEGVGLWDTFGVMGGQGSVRVWESAGLAQRDRIHMTREGYAVLGDLLFSALMEKYGDHVKRSAKP
jgi:lysophospholipase L1-like esterase